MTAMLSKSSNTAANALMRHLGGPAGFTSKAHEAGYTHTDVVGYYQPSNDGKNKSTVSDQVQAMETIFSSNKDKYKTAQGAFENGLNYYHVPGVSAVKAGWTSTVASNVALYKVGSKQYIIGLYYNGNSASDDARKAIKEGSAELAELAQKVSADEGGGNGDAGCCPAVGAAGDAAHPEKMAVSGIVASNHRMSWSSGPLKPSRQLLKRRAPMKAMQSPKSM